MKKILFLFFVLSLVGCQTTTTTTKTTSSITTQTSATTVQTTTVGMLYPSGIIYEEGSRVLSWQAMPGAIGYLITINGSPTPLENPFISLGFLSPGVYVFNLRTVYPNGQSEASIDFEITINTIKTFSGIHFQNDTITFLPFDGEVIIILEIFNGNEIIGIPIFATEIDLSSYYYLSRSFRLVAFENDEEMDDFAFQVKSPISFDRLQVDDFLVSGIDSLISLRLNQILLDESFYDWNSTTKTLQLHSVFIENLPLGAYTLEVTGVQTLFIEMELKESRKPELIGESTKIYTNQSISFTFALYGGVFEGLQGQGITSADYTFHGQTVTILASYLETIKTNHPSLTQIMLSYSLYNHPHSVIGYIIIQIRPTN